MNEATGNDKLQHSNRLRSLFLTTTSLYALLLSAPTIAQSADNPCQLPALPNGLSLPSSAESTSPLQTSNSGDVYLLNCNNQSPDALIIGTNGGDAWTINQGTWEADHGGGAGYVQSTLTKAFSGAISSGGAAYGFNYGDISVFPGTGMFISSTGVNDGEVGGIAFGYNSGTINTLTGFHAHGLSLESKGGNGLAGINASEGSHYNVGGAGGNGGNGGTVTAINAAGATLETYGAVGTGISAMSIGGGGGDGGSAYTHSLFAAVAVGGRGGTGGNGGSVTVDNHGTITTSELNAIGVKAMSIGGGGGEGGLASAQSTGFGGSFSVATGGSGGAGGNGGDVLVSLFNGSSIQTGKTSYDFSFASGSYVPGDHSPGVLAQSIGGGGGNAGHAVAAAHTDLIGVSVDLTFGGSGGNGGNGQSVNVDLAAGSSIVTGGRSAGGIVAHSIGGGGGNGGAVTSHADGGGVAQAAITVGIGGKGGDGGTGGSVDVENAGSVTTYGALSAGITAQSISGGGGNGSHIVDFATEKAPISVNLGVNIGGEGGQGHAGGTAESSIKAGGSVTTYGDHSVGMVVQSIGGTGGNGGSVHSYSRLTGGGTVTPEEDPDVEEDAIAPAGSIIKNSVRPQANGSDTGDEELPEDQDPAEDEDDDPDSKNESGLTLSATVGVGGTGSAAGNGGAVTSTLAGNVTTYGASSDGVSVQSIGGGGGNGGHAFAYTKNENLETSTSTIDTLESSALSATVNIGGSGAAAGDGGTVTFNMDSGTVSTNQVMSSGVKLQSIGGGGGNGGATNSLSWTGSIPTDPVALETRYASFVPGSEEVAKGNLDVALNIGGKGGAGGSGGNVFANLDGGSVHTKGALSYGIIAQSIGGGGGIGGHAVANGFVGIGTYNFTANIGGSGGTGSVGGLVTFNRAANAERTSITTEGHQSYGIFAQSIGGGGGIGGAAHIDFKEASGELANFSVGFTLGGGGGDAADNSSGNKGSSVEVNGANVTTSGQQAHGILAHSIGGGGGAGHSSSSSGDHGLDLGGKGGSGHDGGLVNIHDVSVTTSGALSSGIVAQSIGGGGGVAGLTDLHGHLNSAAANSIETRFNLNMHGSSGDGGQVYFGCLAGVTTGHCDTTVNTSGTAAHGILAQSFGGGGSTTFLNSGGTNANTYLIEAGSGFGGSSMGVTFTDQLDSTFNITTSGDGSIGIIAQAIDGRGGAVVTDSSTSTVRVQNSLDGTDAYTNAGFSLHLNGSINTSGDYGHGIFAQSRTSAFTVFGSDGYNVLAGTDGAGGSGYYNNASNSFYLGSNGTVQTSGAHAHGIVLDTSSNLFAAGTSTAGSKYRAQDIWVDGTISVSGAASWGVYSNNLSNTQSSAEFSTWFTLGSSGVINAGPQSAGGIYIHDPLGTVSVDINGLINAKDTIALSVTGHDNWVSVGDPTLKPDQFGEPPSQSYSGNIVLTSSGGTNTIKTGVYTNILGSITSITNGGTSKINVGNYLAYDAGPAIHIDALRNNNSTITFSRIDGDITGAYTLSSGSPQYTASLNNQGSLTGSIDGPFDYVMSSNTFHALNIDAAKGTGDYIKASTFTFNELANNPGNAQILMTLTSLPTPDFKPYEVLVMFDGANSPQTVDGYFLTNGGSVANYVLDGGLNSDGHYVVNLTDIHIDLNPAGLSANLAATAQKANLLVQNIRSGATSLSSVSGALNTNLLNAINANEGTNGGFSNLEEELGYITGSELDPDIQSSAIATRTTADHLNSCGGDVLASINPLSQGECAWGLISFSNIELNSTNHNEDITSYYVGYQTELSEDNYLGLTFGYDRSDVTRRSGVADGERLNIGAIYKYIDGPFFSSFALTGHYAWSDNNRATNSSTLGNLGTTFSKRENVSISARIRAGYRLETTWLDITPKVDLDSFLIHQFGYEESGSEQLDTLVAATTNVLYDVHPRITVGKHIKLGDLNIRLFGEYGRRFALNDPKLKTGFADVIGDSSIVTISQERENSLSTYGLGAIVDFSDTLEARLIYELSKGDNESIERFSVKFSYKF